MSTLPLIDYLASVQARDEGMQKAAENNGGWFSLAMVQLEQFARTHDGYANVEHGVTGEDLRVALRKHVGNPSNQNAWGSLIGNAVRKGLLVPTGQYRPMKDKSSHARKTPVYSLGGVMSDVDNG